MEIITFESQTYTELVNKILGIEKKIDSAVNRPILDDIWLDNQDVCKLLKISKRTLQSYRDKGILPFSQTGGKIYYKAADLQAHLQKNYVRAFKKVTYV
jgi:hypothetical protein